MKTGLDLNALAAEITRQQNAKRDFVVNTRDMNFVTTGTESQLVLGDHAPRPINDIAHRQIAEHADIPQKYYDRMRREAPVLLADNVREWFTKYPAPRLVRTLDNKARAFLSDRFRALENADLAEAALPAILDAKAVIMSCEITERRLYIKVVDGRIKQDIPTGRKIGDGSHVFFDTVSPAMIIANSEVGLGALAIDYGVFNSVCTNLATISKEGMRRTHVGGKLEAGADFEARLSNETKAAKDKALWLEVRDTVKLAFDEARFQAMCQKLGGLAQHKIDGDPVQVIEVTGNRFGFTGTEKASVLQHLIQGGDLTAYGLLNAVTRTAQDSDTYDRATEMEYVGGRLIELPAGEWRELAKAA